MVFIMSGLRDSRISIVPKTGADVAIHDAAGDDAAADTKLCAKQCEFAANRSLFTSAGETELTVATRRLMQAEENAAQAGARVLLQWNVVQAILAKPPKDRHDGELENAKAALEFAKAAHTDAKESRTASVNASGVAAAAASRSPPSNASSAICDSPRPFAAISEPRHAVAGAADSFSSSSTETALAVMLNDESNAHPLPDAKSKVSFADPCPYLYCMSISLRFFSFPSFFCLLLCLCRRLFFFICVCMYFKYIFEFSCFIARMNRSLSTQRNQQSLETRYARLFRLSGSMSRPTKILRTTVIGGLAYMFCLMLLIWDVIVELWLHRYRRHQLADAATGGRANDLLALLKEGADIDFKNKVREVISYVLLVSVLMFLF
jgi:hypothetical protein